MPESNHIHPVTDTDKHFIIDGTTRAIKNASEVKNKLFKNDHNSEVFTFEMPRCIDGHDMTSCNVIQIHFLNLATNNQDRTSDVYEVNDVAVSGDAEDTITFSWLISRNATRFVGTLTFAIHFACANDGEEVYVWNTAIHNGVTVVDTLFNSEVVVENYSDILEQWKDTLFGSESPVKISAQEAKDAAANAVLAKEKAEAAASTIPAPSPDVAGKGLKVNTEGTGFEFGVSAGGELLLAEYVHQGNQEIYFSSFDWETGIGECTEPHGLIEATAAMVVPNDWDKKAVSPLANLCPIEWTSYQYNLYLLPVSDTSVQVVEKDKITPISVDVANDYNAKINISQLHFEIPVGWKITGFPQSTLSLRIQIAGFCMPVRYRSIQYNTYANSWNNISVPPLHNFGNSKPKNMVFSTWDISMTPFQYGADLYSGSIINKGRRNESLDSFVDIGTNNLLASGFYFDITTKYKRAILGIQNTATYAVFSNKTVVRAYLKGARSE